MGFYCRDEEFVNKTISSSEKIEKFSQGLRPVGNLEFANMEEAVTCALDFIAALGGKKTKSDENIDSNADSSDNVEMEINKKYVTALCEAIMDHKLIPHFPFIIEELRAKGYNLECKSCWFFAEGVYFDEPEE